MAEIAPQRALDHTAPPQARRPERTALIPREQWLPPLLVALITMLALIAGYAARPRADVALGDYFASIYLRGFHEREIAATGPAATLPWPADQETIAVAGARTGYWLITVRTDPALDEDVLRLTMLSLNGERVGVQRRGPHEFTAIVDPTAAAAPTWELQLAPALTGDPVPPVGTLREVSIAPAYAYRWTTGSSEVLFPALGRGAWSVAVDAILLHPDGANVDGVVRANGEIVARLPNTDADGRRVQFVVPARLMGDGDLRLTFAARTYNDPRPLGMLIEDVQITPLDADVPPPPPMGVSLLALVITLGTYGVVWRAARRTWVAAAVGIALALAGALALREARFPTTFMLPGLAGLSAASLLLLVALERLLPWAFARAAAPASGWFVRGLLLVFFASLWLKAGAMLYPYFVGIDVSWHIDRARWILDGQLPLLYGINSPLNESTMPVAEWGATPPVIPYSPWFHMIAATFVVIPAPMELTANLISALLDCSRVLLIALLARACGLGERPALVAGLLYAVTPATFLLHSWGNLPTAYGMWCTLAATVYLAVGWKQLDRRRVLIGLIALLTVTLLVYTVMATFMLVFLGLLVAGLWLFGERSERRSVAALALAAGAALGLATLIYYGQYIQPIIERTIPYFLHAGDGEGVNAVRREPFGEYLAKYWPRMGYLRETGHYGLQLPLLIGLLGLPLIRGRRVRIMLASWLAVGVLFLIAGSRISMVDKHLFYILPALALGAGALLGRLWRRGRAAPLAIGLLFAFTLFSALEMWLYRVVNVQQ